MPPVSPQMNSCEIFYYQTLNLSSTYIQRVPPLFAPYVQNLIYKLGHKIDFPVGDQEQRCLCFHNVHKNFELLDFSFLRKFATCLGVHCLRKDGEYLYYGELFRLEAVLDDRNTIVITPTKIVQENPSKYRKFVKGVYLFHFIYYDYDSFKKDQGRKK